MKPRLLGDNPSSFETLGYGMLNQTISAFVFEELNGDYYLEMEITVDDPNFKNIHVGSVISCAPNKTDGLQGFVVEHIGKPIDGVCEIYATHIAQHRAQLIPVNTFTSTSLANALSLMKSRSMESNPFTITTNKSSTTAMKNVIPHSFRELMGGVEGSLIDTYGGEFHYDNYSIELLAKRGNTTSSIRILYGSNMTDFKLEEDFSFTSSVTGVVPYWAGAEGEVVIGSAQYSTYRDYYAYRKTVPLDCTEQFETKPTAAQLNAYAATYMTSKGLPAVNMEVAFDHLQSSSKNLQIGDTVTVVNKMYNVSEQRRIVATRFNVLSEEYETITIGDQKESVSDAITNLVDDNTSAMKILAENVKYSNAASELTATTAQAALDELSDETLSHNVNTAGQSLDTYRTQGIWFFSANYTPSGAPDGNANGWLVVLPSGGAIKQIWYRRGTAGTNDFNTYVRMYDGSSWSTWVRLYTTADLPSLVTTAESSEVPDFSLNSSGYYNVSSYLPSAPSGYTTAFYLISTWSSISPATAISLTWDGRYILGTASATVKGLKIRAVCFKSN